MVNTVLNLTSCFYRCRLYHHCDLPVESVNNYSRQLSSTLYSQVLETQVLSAQLLQTYLIVQMFLLNK